MEKRTLEVIILFLCVGLLISGCRKNKESGVLDDAILIYTAGDLENMSPDGVYLLANDINLNGSVWFPLEISDKGVFDGNGHTISNFKIDSMGSKDGICCSGFFSQNSGVIQNLQLECFEIEISYADIFVEIGGLVGNNRDGQINNCHINGDMIISTSGEYSDSSTVHVGGVVGSNYKGTVDASSFSGAISVFAKNGATVGGLVSNDGKVSNCHTNCDINVSIKDEPFHGIKIGGISGNSTNIANCTSSGNISITTAKLFYDSIKTDFLVGGIAGLPNGNIDNCSSLCNISLTNYSISDSQIICVGGLSGAIWADQKVSNCFAEGDIVVSSNDDIMVGGLIGWTRYQISSDRWGYSEDETCIFNSYSQVNCSVTKGLAMDDGEVSLSIGGLIGRTSGSTIENCYSVGNIHVDFLDSECEIGGLIGTCSRTSSGDENVEVKDCYSSGNIIVVSKTGTVGGLIGRLSYDSNVESCYTIGNVEVAFSESTDEGYVGGLFGYFDAMDDNNFDHFDRFPNCYKPLNQHVVLLIDSLGANQSNINYMGAQKNIEEMLTVSFHTDILKWSNDMWILKDDLCPTLK